MPLLSSYLSGPIFGNQEVFHLNYFEYKKLGICEKNLIMEVVKFVFFFENFYFFDKITKYTSLKFLKNNKIYKQG